MTLINVRPKGVQRQQRVQGQPKVAQRVSEHRELEKLVLRRPVRERRQPLTSIFGRFKSARWRFKRTIVKSCKSLSNVSFGLRNEFKLTGLYMFHMKCMKFEQLLPHW